ncbi:MAG: 16S rRNA (uracil(1498)-N(3))-methyltransferase [Actinomycetota bacterium]
MPSLVDEVTPSGASTPPLFWVDREELAHLSSGDHVTLDGPQGHHAVTVRRLRVGAVVDIADGASGVVARGVIQDVTTGSARIEVRDVRRESAAQPRFVLVQALAKQDRDVLAIEAATEVGVDEVVPWQAERSVVAWRADRATRAHNRWQQSVQAASQQARRSVIPTVAQLTRLDELCTRVTNAATAILLDGGAAEPLVGTSLPASGEVLLIVGPEGGISPIESAALIAAGATPRRLGPYVLRASTAGPVALAALLCGGRWRVSPVPSRS